MSHTCSVANVLLLKRVQCFASCIDLAGQFVTLVAKVLQYLYIFATLVAKVLFFKIGHVCCKGFTYENLPRLLQKFYS
jgi:hypothetical protein